MKEKVIKTKLIGREELFQTFLIGELSQLPVLVIGEKGTAKTQAFLDYVNGNKNGKVFMRQLNYDTRAEDLLGYISIPALKEGRVERLNGIQDAEYILLDEIDKAPSSVRNLFLSVLRERAIFDGEKFVPCKWKLIVGTSNREIEDFEQEDIPFLDRFILKCRVERVGINNVGTLLSTDVENEMVIPIRKVDKNSYEEAKNIIQKLIVEDLYYKMSDRSIANIPCVLQAVLSVFSDKQLAVIKTLCYLVGEKEVMPLIEKLNTTPEITQAKNLVTEYNNATNDTRDIIVGKMVKFLKSLKTNPDIDRDIVNEVEKILKVYLV